MKFFKILLLLLISIFFSCCKKSDLTPVQQLPNPYISDARSVFGCLVDGEVWKPGNGGLSLNVITYDYAASFGGFVIRAMRKYSDRDINEHISMTTIFKETGKYQLEEGGSFSNISSKCYDYNGTENSVEDYIQIDSLNTEARVIIGRFQFMGIDTFCQDTVRVTDGRFKASY